MKTPLTFLLSLTFLFLFGCQTSGGNFNQDYQRGLDATKRGDYKTAYKFWSPLARKGVASVQYNLGVMYFEGNGVPQDY
jgi:uncharacterized protein